VFFNRWEGKDAIKFLEKMVVGDIASLKPGEAKLSLIMNEKGGIVDDTVITMGDNYVYMVVNGACKDKDILHFTKYMGDFEVTMHHLQSLQLVALQVDSISSLSPLCLSSPLSLSIFSLG
jgi:aminomethyltransferase